MTLKKISIITPSFNQGDFIEDTILSVLNQNYPNLEYIIIDGGSTDNTVEIIKKYEKHLKYWISETDRGQSHAINKGLKLTTGDIINWINSDDYYQDKSLFYIANAFADSKVNMVCGKGKKFGIVDKEIIYDANDIFPENLPKTIAWSRIDQPETFFRRRAVEKIGMLNTSLHYCMDKEWWIKYLFIFGLQGIKRIPNILVNFRYHEDSKSVLRRPRFYTEKDNIYYSIAKQTGNTEIAEIIKEILADNLISEYNFFIYSGFEFDNELTKKMLNYYLLIRGNEFYEKNEKKNSKKIFETINHDYLKKEDRYFLKTLMFRNKYFP